MAVPKSIGADVIQMFLKDCKELGLDMIVLPKHADIRQISPPGDAYFLIEGPKNDRLFLKVYIHTNTN